MEGLSGPQGAGAWRFRRLTIVAAVLVTSFAIVLIASEPGQNNLVATGVGLVGGALSMAVAFALRATVSTGRRRRSWVMLCVAGVLAALSNFLLLTSAAASRIPDRAASDLVLTLALILGIAGVATFPTTRSRSTDLVRMILDGVVLGGSGLFVASVTLFPRILDDADGSSAFSLVVPVFDVVLATVATLLFLRAAPAEKPTLGLVALGACSYAVSDFVYAVWFSDQGYYIFGSPSDLGWIIGYALLALAAVGRESQPSALSGVRTEPSPVAGTAAVFGLFLIAAVLSLVNLGSRTLSPASAALWLIVLLGVLARQILLIVDNQRLRRHLERRVEDRTRELRQETQRSQLLVTSVGEGIYGVDADGRVTFVNPAAADVLGYPPDDLIGRDAHLGFHDNQPDGTPFPLDTCYITEAIAQLKVTNAEEDTYRRVDGLGVPVEVTATPLIDDGRAIGAVVVFRDVTQRRQVDRMKSEFVSMVSHELRTPLTAIHGSLGLIAGGAVGELSPSGRRLVDIALVSSDRLGRLINDILDIERIESGMLSMDLGLHPCRPLIESAVSQVQVLAEEAGVLVSVAGAEGEVYADPDRVVQTLLNLLSNAIKFSHRGGFVSVHSEVRGEVAQFAVRDDGRGIPDDKLDHIFSRFIQVDSSDAREKDGFGLGLAISKGLVERQGGRIWAENNDGAGATVLFALPAHRPADVWSSPPNGERHTSVELVTGSESIKNLPAAAESRF